MAKKIFDHLKETIFRDDILNHRRRPDGRRFSEIRAINCEVGWLPRTHGSALFTRGETQALVRPRSARKKTSSSWTTWKGRSEAPLHAEL
jgi:polyribonucleotide nucleotidyltransferase